MNRLMKIASFFMVGVMSFFSPITANSGEANCCAECAMKREEEVEVVYQEEENQEGGND